MRVLNLGALAFVAAAVAVSFTPATAAPAAYNCPYAGSNSGGLNCGVDEDCCGSGTMSPQCLPKTTDKKCCRHYLSATTCNATQSCCGAYGAGASSYAFCCNEGSTCCHAQSWTQGATCCPTGTTCCAGGTVGLCCAADEDCVPSQNMCRKKTTEAPTTTTAAPAVFNCPFAGSGNGGLNCGVDEDCCGSGSMSPQCLPKSTDKKCCTHFIAATTCNATQSCCGAYGVGASSYAFCCDQGSTCCHAQSMNQGASCCPTGTTCCAGATLGLCCAADEDCVPSQNMCRKKTTEAPNAVPTETPQPGPGPATLPATMAPYPGHGHTDVGASSSSFSWVAATAAAATTMAMVLLF